MKQQQQRRRHIYFCVTLQEYDQIATSCHQSTCRNLSEYIRKTLLGKAVTIRHRNQSLDDLMAELILLRGELNFIIHNYNRNDSAWEAINQKIKEIKTAINHIDDQWLHS
jgi:hypothetical protein